MNPEIIQARKILVRIMLMIFAFAIVFLVYQLLKNGTLKLKLENEDSTATVKVINQADGTEYSVDSFTGSEFSKSMSPGSYEVSVFNDQNQSSTYFLEVNGLRRTTSQDVKFYNQNSRAKLSRDTESCPFLIGAGLYSHNCYTVGPTYSHSKLTTDSYPQKSELTKLAYGEGGTSATTTYRNGVLVLSKDNSIQTKANRLIYINASGAMRELSLPDTFETSTNILGMVADTAGGDGFVVFDIIGKQVAYYSNTSSAPKIINTDNELKTPKEVVQTWVDIRDGKVMITSGIPDLKINHSEEGNNTKYYESPEDMEVRLYSDPENINVYTKLRIDGHVNNARLCEENIICIYGTDNLRLHAIDGDDTEELINISNVTNYQPTVDMGIVYIQDSKIYSYNFESNSSHEIFSSSKFDTSNIVSSKNGLLVNAILKNDSTQSGSHTFLVSNKESKENNFADNYIPYKNKDFGYVRDSDFYRDLVVVDVSLDSWTSDVGQENFTYDQTEFNKKKNFIINDLKKYGITSPEYNIVVKP